MTTEIKDPAEEAQASLRAASGSVLPTATYHCVENPFHGGCDGWATHGAEGMTPRVCERHAPPDYVQLAFAPNAKTEKRTHGSEFLYVRVEVLPADPNRVVLLNGLVEKVTGTPSPDLMPHTDPGAISFKHVRLTAADEAEAYLLGGRLLPAPQQGAVINDYVVRL